MTDHSREAAHAEAIAAEDRAARFDLPACGTVRAHENGCCDCDPEPTTYHTMTVEGGYGSDFTADSDDAAIAQATAAGYDVLDVTDSMSGEVILVIAS